VAAGKLRDRIPKELKSRNVNIDTAYNDLVAVILWIDERSHEVDIASDERSLIAGGCFDMVLEHQNAVARLVENQLYGSALAQLRLIADAHIRGMWFARCATEADAARFRETDYTKKLNDLIKDIETSLGNAPITLSKMVREQWGTLCGFTHTGYKQITRRYMGALLKPNYPEAEVIQGLNFAGAIGLLAGIELAVLSKNERGALAMLERARQFAVRELLGFKG
jgi:hypothetical protein